MFVSRCSHTIVFGIMLMFHSGLLLLSQIISRAVVKVVIPTDRYVTKIKPHNTLMLRRCLVFLSSTKTIQGVYQFYHHSMTERSCQVFLVGFLVFIVSIVTFSRNNLQKCFISILNFRNFHLSPIVLINLARMLTQIFSFLSSPNFLMYI